MKGISLPRFLALIPSIIDRWRCIVPNCNNAQNKLAISKWKQHFFFFQKLNRMRGNIVLIFDPFLYVDLSVPTIWDSAAPLLLRVKAKTRKRSKGIPDFHYYSLTMLTSISDPKLWLQWVSMICDRIFLLIYF